MNFSTNWWRCLKLCTAAVKTLADNLGFLSSRYQIMLYVTRFPSSLLWSCSIEMFYDLRETRFCFNNIEKTPDQDLQMRGEQFFIQNNEDKEYKIETDDTSYGHITTQQSQPLVKVTTSPNNWIFPLVCSAPRLLVSLAQNNDITGWKVENKY